MTQAVKVSYEEAMARFKHVYLAEGLPTDPVMGAEWFATDFACGAVVWVGKFNRFARLKGGVVLPEHRGKGHGEEMILARERYAISKGASELEVFARRPDWFLRHGWKPHRLTKWGVQVLRKIIVND
jgi:GNAT superfamily N-acetyltransferase